MHGWRQYEYAHGFGPLLFHVSCAVNVNIQYNIYAFGRKLFNICLWRAVIVHSEHVHVFKQLVALYHAFKLFARNEEIANAVFFTRARCARCCGYGKAYFIIRKQKRLAYNALAYA